MAGSTTTPSPARLLQIGIVVPDLDEAMDDYFRILGWGPWDIYELQAPHHHGTALHGIPARYSMRLGVAHVSGIDVELIEPLEGESIYTEHLRQHGPGVQHIAVGAGVEGPDSLRQRFRDAGFQVVMSGRVGRGLEYEYVDSPELGLTIETFSGDVEPPASTYTPRATAH